MDITKRVKRDIDIYNGITPEQNISSFSLFNYTNLKIFLIVSILIFSIWFFYNTNYTISDHPEPFKKIINVLKLWWNDIITFFNNI